MAKESRDFEIVSTTHTPALQEMLAKPDAGANPFKIVIDPKVRMDLRRALIDLIDYHDEALADHFAECKLALECTVIQIPGALPQAKVNTRLWRKHTLRARETATILRRRREQIWGAHARRVLIAAPRRDAP